MNKTATSTRFCKFFLVCLLLFTSAFQTVFCQGFFTPTSHALGFWESRFDLLPGAYRVKSTTNSQQGPNNARIYSTLELDNQGAEISYDSILRQNDTMPYIYQLAWLPDNDVLEFVPDQPAHTWTLNKYHLDGTKVWTHVTSTTFDVQTIHTVKQNDSGEIFVIAEEWKVSNPPEERNLILLKLNSNGELLWTINQVLPVYGARTILLKPLENGGCAFSMATTSTGGPNLSQLTYVSASGEIMWSENPELSVQSIEENSQGEVLILLYKFTVAETQDTMFFEKRAASGQIIWSKNLNTIFQKEGVYASNLYVSQNDDIVMAGLDIPVLQDYKHFFARFDDAGNFLWKKHYSFLPDFISVNGGTSTPDNGLILAIGWYLPSSLAVLKMDAEGIVYPSHINGQLAIDNNISCLIDSSEQALANWNVQLTSTDRVLFATTDSSGQYDLADVPGGDYQLSAVLVSNLWESCMGDIAVSIPDTGSVVLTQDLPIQVITDCPFMTLDISTFGLRHCFPSTYNVHYCNSGTIAADSAYITIQLNPFLDLNSASIPFTQSGDTLYFSLGSVASLQCGDFSFNVTVNCDSAQLGQTLCVSAAIFPDTICNPPSNWSGALLRGIGTCLGDSVHFQIENIGTAPSSAGLNSYVVDEHVIMFQQTLPIMAPQETFDITVPADGSTWRFLSQQEPNAPGLEMPSIGVEGCGAGGPPSWGFFLQFANRDGSPFTDQDCHQVVGSYDPNDKMAFPIGVNEEHFIEKNQPIDYQIRFQNTGTDTAFTVVVKDTLSPWLDPATIRPGASSHPYTWALSGAGILTFTFEHILLPDSNINEAASHGFIQFSIDQQKDLSEETLLENRAGIYFDFNEAVMTNTVFHTIQHDFLPVSGTNEINSGLPLLQIWPNPAAQETTIFTDQPFNTGAHLVLRNSLGQVLRDIPVYDQSVKLQRKGLPAGLYFVELRNEQSVLQMGKMIWE